MLKERMELAIEERERLMAMIELIDSSVKDVEKLVYEICFECEANGEKMLLELSNESSRILLNNLIEAVLIIKNNLSEIGFPSKVDMSSYELNKVEEISTSSKSISGIHAKNGLKMLDSIESKLDRVEYFKYYATNTCGKYIISKKNKFKILNVFDKKSFRFKNMQSLNADNNQYEIFNNSLKYLNTVIYKAIDKDMFNYVARANELKIFI